MKVSVVGAAYVGLEPMVQRNCQDQRLYFIGRMRDALGQQLALRDTRQVLSVPTKAVAPLMANVV